MKAVAWNAISRNSSQCQGIANLLSGLRINRPVVDFVRVMSRSHTGSSQVTGLSTSNGPSRFSPVNAGTAANPKFSILYGARDLATASYEKIIRDRFDLDPSRVLVPSDYRRLCAVNFSTQAGQQLALLDLRSGNAIRYGVPTDVICYSNHRDGQHFSEFVYKEMPFVDGILYSSRFTQIDCVGIYDRGVHKLTSAAGQSVLTKSILATALGQWNISVS